MRQAKITRQLGVSRQAVSLRQAAWQAGGTDDLGGHRRRPGGLGVPGQQLLDQRAAAPAGDAGAAAAPDLLEVAGSGRDRLADLPVGDGPAVADEHRPEY